MRNIYSRMGREESGSQAVLGCWLNIVATTLQYESLHAASKPRATSWRAPFHVQEVITRAVRALWSFFTLLL